MSQNQICTPLLGGGAGIHLLLLHDVVAHCYYVAHCYTYVAHCYTYVAHCYTYVAQTGSAEIYLFLLLGGEDVDTNNSTSQHRCSNRTDDNLPPSQDGTPQTAEAQEFFLPWVVAGVCSFLSLMLIVSNLVCFLAMWTKRRKQPSNTEVRSSCSNGQNLACNSVQENSEDQSYFTLYENNPVYGHSPEVSCSNGQSLACDSLQEDQTYSTLYENNPVYGHSPGSDRSFDIEMNPSYYKEIKKEQQFTIQTNPSYKQITRSNTASQYRNLTASYATEEVDGYVNC